jgi:hypothetical protein
MSTTKRTLRLGLAALVSLSLAVSASGCGKKKKKRSHDDEPTSATPTETTPSASASEGASASASGSGAPPEALASATASALGSATPSAPKAVDGALVEERDEARLAWVVTSDGAVALRVQGPGGDELPPADVAAKVKREDGAWVTLIPSISGRGLAGAVGALGPGLHGLSYEVTARGASLTGTFHVPEGGTAALLAPPSVAVAPGTKGPNGGLVDVVGSHRVELVVDEATGELRVYFLDDQLKVIPPPEGVELSIAIEDGVPSASQKP